MEEQSGKLEELKEQIQKLEVTAKFYEYKYKEELEKVVKLEKEKENYPYAYEHPHPAVTTDCVIFSYEKKQLQVLLIQRGENPYKDAWALPGGFLCMDNGHRETLEECAKRELEEETGYVNADFIEQFHAFSAVDRDPRSRVITVAYFALAQKKDVHGGDDAKKAEWFNVNELPAFLAFDHKEILDMAREKLKEQIHFQPIGFDLLPDTFTMSELQHLYETILDVKFDRRNFYKKMILLGLLEIAEERPTNAPSRVSVKYRFKPEVYQEFKKKGFRLEF